MQDINEIVKGVDGSMGNSFIQNYGLIGGALGVIFIVFKSTIEQIIKQNNEIVNHLLTLNEEMVKSNNKLIETNNRLTDEIKNLREDMRKGV
ncbi:MAG: hypothetical protein ACRCZ0_12500 [Cetobacterium sp.]